MEEGNMSQREVVYGKIKTASPLLPL